jgi:hypothetical protein
MLLLEPPYRQLLVLIVTGLVLSVLWWLGYRARPKNHGWRRIEPGPMHWFGLVLGVGLVGLFLYIRLFVGSSRADAASQMQILTWLIVAFSIGSAIVAYDMARTKRLSLEWRGNWIAYSGQKGLRVSRTLDELVGVHGTLLGWVVLSFSDGESVRVSESARGTHEFCDVIVERRPDLFVSVP